MTKTQQRNWRVKQAKAKVKKVAADQNLARSAKWIGCGSLRGEAPSGVSKGSESHWIAESTAFATSPLPAADRLEAKQLPMCLLSKRAEVVRQNSKVGSSGPRLRALRIVLGCCHQFSNCHLDLTQTPRGSVRVLPRHTEGRHMSSARTSCHGASPRADGRRRRRWRRCCFLPSAACTRSTLSALRTRGAWAHVFLR